MSVDSSVKTLNLLKTSLVGFFDELIEMFPKQGDFVAFRIMIKDRIPVTEVVTHFSKTLLPQKSVIKSKTSGKPVNVSLVQVMSSLFNGIGISSNTFEGLLKNLDSETEEAMWRWLDVFVTLTEKCQ